LRVAWSLVRGESCERRRLVYSTMRGVGRSMPLYWSVIFRVSFRRVPWFRAHPLERVEQKSCSAPVALQFKHIHVNKLIRINNQQTLVET
jgi:hypothetical protein